MFNPFENASFLTEDWLILRPLPDCLSGAVTTPTILWLLSKSASKQVAAKLGVPIKTMFNFFSVITQN